MYVYLLLVAILGITNGKPSLPPGRIYGGDNAVIETYPYQVSVEFFGTHQCGGSIISKYYVLTAGHCVKETGFSTVRVGSSYITKGGVVHKIEKFIRHENYYMNDYGSPVNDIAIIKVKQPFEFDDTHEPIELFNVGEEAPVGVNSVITGWGATENGTAEQLRIVTIPIISKDLCRTAYSKIGGLPYGQICAAYYGEGGKDACHGDSGGPLVIDGRLAGIVSWGNGCARPYYPGAYTEIAYYRDWIKEKVEF